MDIAQHEPTCRVRRHAHVQHLVVADETTLAELEAALATMPICATGRVFVEVPDASWIGDLTAPARMVVTWFARASRGATPGDLVARAASAWADEVLCEVEGQTRVLLLGGAYATGRVAAHLTGRLDVDPAVIRIPAPVR